ncbi:Gfo/Idh/MocA family oxidoreductase [Salibacter sp.]|uniref:Gfo/Idh/MocA family protein n=1 Tax=Salibacter sp. TaxID=2010995 RepID=UPI00286FEECD|nr:Gfo/Idh/MocA family oxidoreductase [Salibacter sp.]MDR9399035.1 Gfo/Idh/MocA family oxidoreductase [Salibacter sp.]MDR9487299.1 Gfo/Idh/MocA family oxidoreductase [Salibacter sp.]
MEKIKFAVIGLGHIGRRHATIINEFPNAELVGLMDKNDEASKHELVPANIPFYTSLEQMIKETEPDVINICTPNGSHSDYALDCLQHKRHVVIEKPMGLSKAKAEEVIFKALQVSKQVFVVKQNRYSPPSKWLKEIVEDEMLGDIHMVQINCYWNRDDRYYKKGGWKGNLELDGGTLYTQFSHFIDIMYWVFGDITNIKANFADFNHQELTDFEDSGVVNFNFVNGGVGCINFSTAVWDTNMESSITVVGSKGSIKIGGQYMNEIEYCHVDGMEKPELPPTNPPNDYGPFKGSAANHHYVIENVVNTLNGKDTITANALEGLKVVEIIERIYETRDLAEIKKKK